MRQITGPNYDGYEGTIGEMRRNRPLSIRTVCCLLLNWNGHASFDNLHFILCEAVVFGTRKVAPWVRNIFLEVHGSTGSEIHKTILIHEEYTEISITFERWLLNF